MNTATHTKKKARDSSKKYSCCRYTKKRKSEEGICIWYVVCDTPTVSNAIKLKCFEFPLGQYKIRSTFDSLGRIIFPFTFLFLFCFLALCLWIHMFVWNHCFVVHFNIQPVPSYLLFCNLAEVVRAVGRAVEETKQLFKSNSACLSWEDRLIQGV